MKNSKYLFILDFSSKIKNVYRIKFSKFTSNKNIELFLSKKFGLNNIAWLITENPKIMVYNK